ncbi:hypothetical protein Sjap_011585 [Stephania japonica]|uniref:Uncharacterized protein n=1 Tax=Stephania japonica TaxID=461633 RepID=A0AAP0JBT3_9MAGN
MALFFWSELQSDLIQMAVSFKYWDECLDPQDLEALWGNPEVSKQRIDAREDRGQKVLLSRDPDGQPYLTQTEMTVLGRDIPDDAGECVSEILSQ